MRLEAQLVIDVVRILGGGSLGPDEAEFLAQRLGSTEEFLASLVLQDALQQDEPELVNELHTIAKAEVTRAETRRRTSQLDAVRTSRASQKVAEGLSAVVSASLENQRRDAALHLSLLELALRSPRALSLRHALGIANADLPDRSE